LKDYFDLAMTAISDDEQAELVFMEPALRNMLRDIETTFKPYKSMKNALINFQHLPFRFLYEKCLQIKDRSASP